MVTKISRKKNLRMPESIPAYRVAKGLSEKVVREISLLKGEPRWMLDFRLDALNIFYKKSLPVWGPDISGIDFNEIYYYVRPLDRQKKNWKDLPPDIKKTFDALGIPEAEKKLFAGVGAQYDSEVIYRSLKDHLASKGVIFIDTDTALKIYPEIFREYFSKAVPSGDNKFSALNSAVWSGGSFVYVPSGVEVEIPMQAYFRINSASFGQFERTLIVAEEGSRLHYLEACSAPLYSTDSLHAAVVEIFVKKGAKVRYTTVQNWSKNVYNLVTKRAFVEEGGEMLWVDGNIGSKITMKYPSCFLRGRGAKGEVLSFAYAGKGQIQDTGGKMVHLAPHTTSRIISKSISRHGGFSGFRASARVVNGAKGAKTHMRCDALILDKKSRAETFPVLKIDEQDVSASHEAAIGKIGQEQLFYLRSRGFSEQDALAMIVTGFFEPIVKEIPLEYAVELNRLMGFEMRGF